MGGQEGRERRLLRVVVERDLGALVQQPVIVPPIPIPTKPFFYENLYLFNKLS
jgi:hypothetical protein